MVHAARPGHVRAAMSAALEEEAAGTEAAGTETAKLLTVVGWAGCPYFEAAAAAAGKHWPEVRRSP